MTVATSLTVLALIDASLGQPLLSIGLLRS